MLCIHVMQAAHGDLAGVDLNLALALDALLAERHVTRAAARLGITQSAASHALARLRDLLGDPLLVRGPGGTLVPTARATALAPTIARVLAELGTALRGAPPAFDPATAHRTFHLATSDYVELLLLPRLAARLAARAPHIDLWAHVLVDWGDRELASGEMDLVLGPLRTGGVARASTSIYEKALFAEKFRCVVRADHPLASAQRMTLARYCASAHVLVAPRGRPGSFVDDALAAQGRARRVALAVPHFLVVPHVLATTDLVATLASRIVDLYRDTLGLVDFAPPLAIPDFTIAAAWHERAHHDPAHRWLREQVFEVAAEL